MKIRKYILWCLMTCWASVQLLQAQQITQIEYWIGEDFANSVTHNLNTSEDFVTLDIPYVLNNDNNVSGTIIHYRFKDNQGHWGAIYSQPMVAQNEEHLSNTMLIEYWYDSDFENRAQITLTNHMTGGVWNGQIADIPLLSSAEKISYRFKDAYNQWSAITTSQINSLYIENNTDFDSLEYWYDNKFENRQQILLGKTFQENGIQKLDATIQLPSDAQYMHYRFFGEQKYSSVFTSLLEEVESIPPLLFDKIEYWFDNDFEHRQIATLNNQVTANPNNILLQQDINWPQGAEIIYYRFYNALKHTTAIYFYHKDIDQNDNNSIANVEYWYNDDFENRQSKTVAPDHPLFIDLQTFSPQWGVDTVLHVRYCDQLGNWSSILSNSFEALAITSPLTIEPENHDFDTVNVNKIAQQQITITNNGTTPINITNFVLEGTNAVEFTHNGVNNTEIGPNGGIYQFDMTFSPLTQGYKTANLILTDNATAQPRTILLYGMAIDSTSPEVPKPIILVDNQCGQSVLTASGYTGNLTWSTGETLPSITVEEAGIYSVTQTIDGSTSEAAVATATPKEVPSVPIITQEQQCGQTILTATDYVGDLIWSTGDTTNSISVEQNGNYEVTITNPNNQCTNTHTETVLVYPIPQVSITGYNEPIYEGDTIILSASFMSGATYQWSNGATTQAITIAPAIPTTYSVILTDENGCTASASVEVLVNSLYETYFEGSICLGDTFSEYGFNITPDDAGIHNYSETYTAANGGDSIVYLKLTVHPSYDIVIEDEVCRNEIYNNHGFEVNTDVTQQPGLYTFQQSYQTIFGCDSIRTLQLEVLFDNLGDISYVSPSNNANIESLAVTLNWDDVIHAKQYDLYIWKSGENKPTEPTVANIATSKYTVYNLENNTGYLWSITAKNMCVEVEGEVQFFNINIPPALTLNCEEILDFGEVTYQEMKAANIIVSGTALQETISYQLSGEDATEFGVETLNNWDNLLGGQLKITFQPAKVQHKFNAKLTISSGEIVKEILLTGRYKDFYVFNTYINENGNGKSVKGAKSEHVFSVNEAVPIAGDVHNVLGQTVSNLAVDVYVNVMNMRRTISAVTDEEGKFAVVFTPINYESGYYTIGSCMAGDNKNEMQDDFDIPGMMSLLNGVSKIVTTEGIAYEYKLPVKNKSSIALTDITVSALDVPNGFTVTNKILNLAPFETDTLVLQITGHEITTGNKYLEAKLQAVSQEGALLNFSMGYYCLPKRAEFQITPSQVNTTMVIARDNIFDVSITNNGQGTTGNIMVTLPEGANFMSLLQSDTLSALLPGQTAVASLRLKPQEDTPLNVPLTGQFVISCENGNSIVVPYNIQAVSDSTGTLIVDVTDDFTYNSTDGSSPHLQDAKVLVKHIYAQDTVAMGMTNEAGIFRIDSIPEGYYAIQVYKDRHSFYTNNIQIVSGQTLNHLVYLQYHAIQFDWVIVPTEIEDEYELELVMDFETNVPAPVVTIDYPNKFEELNYGESYTFNIILENHGLIHALDTKIIPPDGFSEYKFIPLYEVIDTLPAKTKVSVPCQITRIEQDNGKEGQNCHEVDRFISTYKYYCNLEGIWEKTPGRDIKIKKTECDPVPIEEQIENIEQMLSGGSESSGSFAGFGGFNGFGSFNSGATWTSLPAIGTTSNEKCEPCNKSLFNLALDIPVLGDAIKLGHCGVLGSLEYFQDYASGILSVHDILIDATTPIPIQLTKNIGNCLLEKEYYDLESGLDMIIAEKAPFIGQLKSAVDIGESSAYVIENCIIRPNIGRSNTSIDSKIGEQYNKSIRVLEINYQILTSIFKEPEWREEILLPVFWYDFTALMDTNSVISASNIQLLKDSYDMEEVSDSIIEQVVYRWNRSVQYWANLILTSQDLPEGYNPNFIEFNSELFEELIDIQKYAENNGFEDVQEMFDNSIETIEAYTEGKQQVCAKVTLNIQQKITMTREAFEGTLTIFNGHESEALNDLNVDFIIKDEEGNVSNNLFEVHIDTLYNISGQVDGSGSIVSQEEGIVKVVFIPTKGAAPTESKMYSFGGTVTYLDPYSGESLSYNMFPATVTVNPSPDLYINYFMQRNILGDDALTEDVVEPMVPAELGVMIHNKGAGTAKNVIIESSQPKVVDNEKGLAIDFKIVGSSLNGEETQLKMMDIPFGDIESSKTAVGRWWMTSTLLGHFVNYQAHVIHNTSFGNPDLSLVSSVNIHELSHSIYAYSGLYNDSINDFLVNDVPDPEDIPDKIFFSNGDSTMVKKSDTLYMAQSANDSAVLLYMQPQKVGWNYGKMDDPYNGTKKVKRCVRNSDNQEIPLDNIWFTFVTIPDAQNPIYEHKLHFVDTLSGNQLTSYTLFFYEESLLTVDSIVGFNGEEVLVSCEPVQSVEVRFDRAILESSFNNEDLTLTKDFGVDNLIDETVVISKINDSVFTVNLSNLTMEQGRYQLIISTNNIQDASGVNGKSEKVANWQQGIQSLNIEGYEGPISAGECVTLTAVGNVPINSYEWSTGETTQSIHVSPNVTTTYSVTVYDENTCSATAEVEVEVTLATIPVTGVSLDISTATITLGNTQQLTATVSPSNATNQNVIWSSSNNSIATVDNNGLVSAVGLGNAVITVTTEDGGFTATCSLTVEPSVVRANKNISSRLKNK